MTGPDRARLLKPAHDHIKEFNKWTPESVLAYREPSSTHEYRPASLGIGRLNHSDLTATLNNMRLKVPEFKFTIIHDETIVDVEQRKVLLYLKCHAPTTDRTEIEKSVEFMDSDYAHAFMTKLGLIERPDPLQK
ncbi:dihydroxyacetone synthase [Fusarium albosuccineum]|uniref:Dihydroxyacetone synthase n=1 Tax=Fusarium albosuccineum TaxID=1237068 RepID=A0A8H4L0D8_9HYPO|nr:dihydroxyacetone synthase [Fusarium albosuccineum]